MNVGRDERDASWGVAPPVAIPLRRVVVGVDVVGVVNPPPIFDDDEEEEEAAAGGVLVVCSCDGDDAEPTVEATATVAGTLRVRRRSGTGSSGGFEPGELVRVAIAPVVTGCDDDDDDDDDDEDDDNGLPINNSFAVSDDRVDVAFPREGLFNAAAVDGDAGGNKELDDEGDATWTMGLLWDNGEVTTVVSDSYEPREPRSGDRSPPPAAATATAARYKKMRIKLFRLGLSEV